MKTETLIELQRSITQGEWTVLPGGDVCTTLKIEIDFGGAAGKRPVQLLVGKVNNYTTEAPEPVANARAIALVPELIAEVIRLREALSESMALNENFVIVDRIKVSPVRQMALESEHVSIEEYKAIVSALEAGRQYGYGNVISWLATEWAFRLRQEGLSESTAINNASNVSPYPLPDE